MTLDDSINGPATRENLLDTIAATLFVGSCIAYLGVVIVGLPTLFVLKVLRAQRGIVYMFVGSFSAPLLLAFNGDPLLIDTARLFLAALPGLLVAGCWWLLATL